MGASSRAAHAIEPANGDLLTPGRVSRARPSRPRDVEDACFETIGASRDSHVRKPDAAPTGGVFKSRLEVSPGYGPFPPDYAEPESPVWPSAERSGRLDVFSSDGMASSSGRPWLTLAASAAFLAIGGFAAAGLWKQVMPAPTQLEARIEAPVSQARVADTLPAPAEAPLAADPVTTSAVPAGTAGSGNGGYTTPAPRPARIEKAGSILMIRPSDN